MPENTKELLELAKSLLTRALAREISQDLKTDIDNAIDRTQKAIETYDATQTEPISVYEFDEF